MNLNRLIFTTITLFPFAGYASSDPSQQNTSRKNTIFSSVQKNPSPSKTPPVIDFSEPKINFDQKPLMFESAFDFFNAFRFHV